MPSVAATTDLEGDDLLDSPAAGGAAIRGGAVRAAGYGIITLLGLATAPFLVRHLGYIGFGRYTTVVSLIAVVATVTEAGLAALALPTGLTPYLLGCALATGAVTVVGGRLLALPPRAGGGDEDGRGGPGDGGPGDGGPGEPSPPWWPAFERDLREHLRERERSRPPVH